MLRKKYLIINMLIPFNYKLGCAVRKVVDSILPNSKFGPNDHRKDASPFNGYAAYRMPNLSKSKVWKSKLEIMEKSYPSIH